MTTGRSDKEKNKKSKVLFILKKTLTGSLIFFLISVLTAHLIVLFFNYKNGKSHAHGMEGILYIWYGFPSIIVGAFSGFYLAQMNKSNINEKLIISSIVYIIIFTLLISLPAIIENL